MGANKVCGGCLFYISTYLGGECRLTDNQVDYGRRACINYMNEDGESADDNDTASEMGKRNDGKKRNTKQNAKR